MRFYFQSTALKTTFLLVFCLLTIFCPREKASAQPNQCARIRYVRSLAIEENLDGRNLAILEARYCNNRRSRIDNRRSRTVRNRYWIMRFDSPLIIHKLQRDTDSLRDVPENTTQLIGSNTRVDYIRDLPSGLKVLDLSDTQVEYIRNLPSELEVLDLSDTRVEYIRNLPSELEVLDLSDTRVEYIRNLPSELEVLDLSSTQVDYIRNLPSELKVLNLANTPIEELRNLPSGLKVLDIRNTRIDDLDNLPSSIECIIVNWNIQDSREVKNPTSCPILPWEILSR